MSATTIFHSQFSNEYHSGFEAKVDEIQKMGWNAARDKFNADVPNDAKLSMPAYYFSRGECDALLQYRKANYETRFVAVK